MKKQHVANGRCSRLKQALKSASGQGSMKSWITPKKNLFFRLLHLTRLGVKLVFVVDGKPPEVKWNAIAKRIQARQHGGGQFWKAKNPGKMGSAARVGRSHFAVWVRECRTLLNLLGVPCIESTGEAEALCAWLDLHQIVDGCITNDGDAFLYGARTVYKDLCISGKDASVECYKIEEIETKLNLNRQKLVALGILLGCDYLPQGVAGVGKEIAMRLIKNVNHDNLIDRFYEWAKSPTDLDENLSSVEKSVKCKALKDKNFPHPEVNVTTVHEYGTFYVVCHILLDGYSGISDSKSSPSTSFTQIFNPDLQGLQEFCLKNLEWPEEYTREKVVLLITYWQMTSSLQHYTTTLVQPERIVKARIQQKIECYEVEWENVQLGETCPASFVTIETKQLFAQVYPELVEEFNDNEAVKLSKKSKKKKPAKLPATSDGYENEVELLSKQLEDLSVHHSSEQCHSSEAQHEKPLCFVGAISIDDSLQDIIDSILPSDSNDHSSHCLSLERSSPFTKMDGIKMKLSAADVGGNDNDDDNGYDDDWKDDKDNGYNDDDDDDFDEEDDDGVGGGDDDDGIPWDFKPLHTQVVAANLDHESGSESNDDSQKLKTLKDVKATQISKMCWNVLILMIIIMAVKTRVVVTLISPLNTQQYLKERN
ncbi:Flap endonuclease GEN 1 [Desmophyllum pertusum]|uniref:Flap endonuclease GEN 1 n=1 Tax=Desmophyllum pertusum TaxID=174260 RepID=A0A9X0A2H8_9CNID|nr:Flap endonuclease GEN 1 [Desmophyllum pertusum]